MVSPIRIRREILEGGLSEKVTIRKQTDTIKIRKGTATQKGFENVQANLKHHPLVEVIDDNAEIITIKYSHE